MAIKQRPSRPVYLTVAEAASELRYHEKTVRLMIRRGELPAWQVRGEVRIRAEDVDAMIRPYAAGPARGAASKRGDVA